MRGVENSAILVNKYRASLARIKLRRARRAQQKRAPRALACYLRGSLAEISPSQYLSYHASCCHISYHTFVGIIAALHGYLSLSRVFAGCPAHIFSISAASAAAPRHASWARAPWAAAGERMK
jgi:hypothetical protein